MQATQQQIQKLEQLQEIDRASMQAQNELDNLPQRQQVLDGRSKRKGIQEKLDQVSQLLSTEQASLQKLKDEDERLDIRQQTTQKMIDEEGDYRRITTLTRDLEGMAKRRETLSFQMDKSEQRVAEVTKVRDTAAQAIEAIDQREQELVKQHQQRSAQLSEVLAAAAQKRAQLVTDIPQDILKAYSEALQRCKGVGLGHLEAGLCSACRTPLDAERLLRVRQEAPLASCPSCKRLLIVLEDEE